MKPYLPSGLMLDIVTMPRPVLSLPVRQVVVRSFEGELAILTGHMPVMALLLPCVVQVWPAQPMGTAETVQWVFISGGVLEVQPQHVTILAEEALFAEEIDIEHARANLADAHLRMRENFLQEDRERARIEAMSAQAQIDLWQWAQE
ncbi:MAG: ATP synthase F1 subunit epsilon, partial [Gammaproteobacteria bacterium 28-57-27]